MLSISSLKIFPSSSLFLLIFFFFLPPCFDVLINETRLCWQRSLLTNLNWHLLFVKVSRSGFRDNKIQWCDWITLSCILYVLEIEFPSRKWGEKKLFREGMDSELIWNWEESLVSLKFLRIATLHVLWGWRQVGAQVSATVTAGCAHLIVQN